jgi:hypothetical protein
MDQRCPPLPLRSRSSTVAEVTPCPASIPPSFRLSSGWFRTPRSTQPLNGRGAIGHSSSGRPSCTVLPRVWTRGRWTCPTTAACCQRLQSLGRHCRVATALICPADIPRTASFTTVGSAGKPGLRSEFYGWSLMVQPPGVRGRAFVDRDAENSELPACFELPLELVDRISFLESRGFRTRTIALITRPEDFEPVAGVWRNRFRPAASFRRPCRLDRLL